MKYFFREVDDIIFEDFARLRLKGEPDAWPCTSRGAVSTIRVETDVRAIG